MSDPFVGEIRLFAFPRVPTGWLACNGQPLSISTYQTLYAVIGTTYGGDGGKPSTCLICRAASRSARGRAPIFRTMFSASPAARKLIR